MASPIIKVLDTESDVSKQLCQLVITRANLAVKEKGIFTIGLSGGSAAKMLCAALPEATTDWSKWRVFFCDERHVPFDNPECTFSFYKNNLMSKVPLSDEHIFPLNPNVTVAEAADLYIEKLRSVFPGNSLPRFDLLVLGMGPDGHTCSLFPGHPLLNETSRITAAISDSPKPPPCRVTLTYPVINNAACAVFASCGAAKADIVQQVLEGKSEEPLPAARVKPTNGEVIWILDKGAAAKLTSANQKL
ncbi:6-phosphogluconolactonase isoform X1 [Aplysia californica]|uniref:6-phosphogluconolactonase n=2 Tax=Aplysia californica TaxID=6500 RepID=A0ABM0J9X6_APLCA|nr:6-phosphogluconolactonase isoform X1 [Aplysia californica]